MVEWSEVFGERAKLVKEYEAKGFVCSPVPDMPDLPNAAVDSFLVFRELHSTRGSGISGPAAITLSDFAAYCELYGISQPGTRQRLWGIIHRADITWCNHKHQEAQADGKGRKPTVRR